MTKPNIYRTAMMSLRNWVFPGSFVLGVVLTLFGGASVSYAQTTLDPLLDPLHGVCDAPTPACTDNGTVTPTTSTSPHYGFTVSPGPHAGVYEVVSLIPNNVVGANLKIFSVTGGATSPAPATLFSSTAWTSGFLDAYLGIVASPANPLSAFLTTTQANDPGATGYFVYVAMLGTNTLLGPSATTATPVLFDGSFVFPIGSSIVAFLNEGTSSSPNWIATAPSGQLSIQPAPEPASILLFGTGLLLVGGMLRRRLLAA
jgi:PEP-CTERM motif